MAKRPFCPRSLGFFSQWFSTEEFSDSEICDAIQCISTNSAFFNQLLTETSCADVLIECPETEELEECAAFIRELLTQSGAQDALTEVCGPGFPPVLNSILRQYLANLLNVCISAETRFGCVGGVLLGYRVDLTDEQAEALGFATDQCVTVEDVLDLAEEVLNACGLNYSEETLETLADVLDAMAQDADETIIEPVFC